ncbi:hypothetical protein ACS0TY_018386 [Phlomoides rotata]
MKIISYNIRGVGSRTKRKEVRDLVKQTRADVCCIQESKKEQVSEIFCKSLWGNWSKIGWAIKGSEGSSGGIITIWNAETFSSSSNWHAPGMLVVNGFWIASGVPCVIINVYSSCYLVDKLRMWDMIKSVSLQNSEECVCVVGDFNAIKEESERVGRAEFTDQRGIRLFQEFIDQSMLIDLPLCGRSYTWYRPDGSCKSRLDRLLVNDQWLHTWPNASLKGMRRSVSDHCPIFTDFGKKNWVQNHSVFSIAGFLMRDWDLLLLKNGVPITPPDGLDLCSRKS